MSDNSFISINSGLDRLRKALTGHIKLLCIEDNIELCSLLCEDFFRSPVFCNKTATTFDAAKSAVSSKIRYHCWILDLTLEKHNDALELLKIKQNFPYCIVLSGAQSLSDATMAFREGAYGAYDKNAIFISNPHEFIKETCSLSVLSFLLNARKPDRMDMFFLLMKKHSETSEEWSRFFGLNERSIRDICEENSGLTAKQFLCFYHALKAIVLSDCLIEGLKGYDEALADLNGKKEFYEQCAEYVLHNFDTIYVPLFVKDLRNKTIDSANSEVISGNCLV
jgi:hypothetical protein